MSGYRSSVTSYAVVAGLTACALVASLLLKKIVEPNFFLPFIGVVLVSTWFFGRTAGLVGTLLGAAVVDFFFMEPVYSFNLSSWTTVARLITFVLSALLVTFLVDALRSSKLKLTETLSSIGDAVIVTDRSGAITYLNPVAEAMLGHSLRELRGKQLSESVNLQDEITGEPIETPIREILRDGIAFQANTHKLLVSRDGHRISIEESAAPVRNERGRVAGAICVFRDITSRREMQNQVNQGLKMEAVGRLAGGVAGDFNNLLTVITGYSEMLRSELSASNPLRRFAEEIFTAADRAGSLTHQLLAFSRGQAGQAKLLDVNAHIAGMEKMLQRLLGEKINLVLMAAPGLGKVKADPSQMEQVIVNLALNSRDAMPNGGKFVIETANLEVTPDDAGKRPGLKPGDYVMIAVSDTGCGMDAETRAHLFEPFFTTKSQGKATGLGLSIVYGIVQQSKGWINVYSQLNAGTIFEIHLPREKEAPAGVVAVTSSKGQRGSETILIADDEDGVRKLMHAVLATHGYQVLETRDGREALSAYEANPAKVDLVLTDVVMPHLNGMELGDRLYTLNPKLKVLYISGYRDSPPGYDGSDRERLFLYKPFTPDALLRKVREILDTPV